MAKIDRPGMYQIPLAEYISDNCVGPSMRSSVAVAIMEHCPARAWYDSPLNPAYVSDQSKIMDLGAAVHVAALEPDLWAERVRIIDAPDFRASVARQLRDDAYNRGVIPLLGKDAERAVVMANAIRKHPVCAALAKDGQFEHTLVWHDEIGTGLWSKARPDYRAGNGSYLIDLKTTTSAHPRTFERHVYDMRYHQQAAWYCEAEWRVHGEWPDRYIYIVQERDPPHLVSVLELDHRAIEWGHRENQRARLIWAACLKRNEFPGYRRAVRPGEDDIFPISLPTYAEHQLEDRVENPRLVTDLRTLTIDPARQDPFNLNQGLPDENR